MKAHLAKLDFLASVFFIFGLAERVIFDRKASPPIRTVGMTFLREDHNNAQ